MECLKEDIKDEILEEMHEKQCQDWFLVWTSIA